MALTPPRTVPDLAASFASGAEVKPLLDVAFALERTVLTGVPLWVVWASVVPVELDLVVVTLLEGVSVVAALPLVVERLVPVIACLRVVLVSVFEVPVLRRAAVPVLLPLLLVPLLRFTWLLEVVPALLPVFPLLLPRRTWVEVLLEGVAVLRFAVLV